MREKEFVRPMKFHISTDPASIHNSVLVELIGLIQDGGEVSMDVVLRNIRKAAAVAWASDGGHPIAVAVLKNPIESYKYKVFDAAGEPDKADQYPVELGYVYVNPRYRGQGKASQLIQDLMKNTNSSVFATTRESNNTMNTLLTNAGFKNIGNPYQSSRGNYNLLLWVN